MSVATPTRYRLDVLGASALLLTGAALAGGLVLLRPSSAVPTASAAVGSPALSAVPMRDQWYLDQEPAAPTRQRTAFAAPPTKDGWYLDMASTATPARDRWYLDGR